jgi:hypothetical protein
MQISEEICLIILCQDFRQSILDHLQTNAGRIVSFAKLLFHKMPANESRNEVIILRRLPSNNNTMSANPSHNKRINATTLISVSSPI